MKQLERVFHPRRLLLMKGMKVKRANVVIKMIGPLLILSVLASGCAVGPTDTTKGLLDNSDQLQSLSFQIAKQPDLPDWQVQREKITQALGDKVFDKEFGRVFDSLIVALGTMGVQVGGVQRDSGFISAYGCGALLPKDRAKELQYNSLVEYCRYSNVNPDLLRPQARGNSAENDITRPEYHARKAEWYAGQALEAVVAGYFSNATMTISLVKQSAKQTKVKLRFSKVYYPPIVEELYKTVWPSLDKQIFMDQGTD